jgi:hypothetical protein
VPFVGTPEPFRDPLTAFLEVQVRVEGFPETIDVGLAEIPAATGPDAEIVTVAALVAVWPDADVATNV